MNKKLIIAFGLVVGCQSLWTNDSYVRENPGYCPPTSEPPPVAAIPAPLYDRELTGCTKEELISAIKEAKTRAQSTAYKLALKSGCVYEIDAIDNYWYGPNGLPEIDFALEIEGRGATIRRRSTGQCSELTAAPFRLFYVAGALSPGLNPGSLTLRNLTLAGGFARGGAGGAAQIRDPSNGPGVYGGGGGAAGLGGAIFVHGNVVLSAVSVLDSCARGGNGGLGGAELKYCGGGGGGMGGEGGSPIANDPVSPPDAKYGGGGGGFRTSGDSASVGGIFVELGIRPDTGASAYGPGLSIQPLSGQDEAGGKGTARTGVAAAYGGLGGGNRVLGGQGGAVSLPAGRYVGNGGSGGQLSSSTGTCGAGGGAGFGGDGGQNVTCSFLTGTLPAAAGGGGGFGGGGGGGDGRGPGGGGGVGGGGGGAGLGSDESLQIGGGGGGFGGGGGGGGANGGSGGFGGGGGSGANESGGPGFGGGRGSRSNDCMVGGMPATGGGGGGLGAGGAIFVHEGTLSASNSTFARNRARGGAGSGGKGTCAEGGHSLGGAVFNLNGRVSMVNVSAVANDVGVGAVSGTATPVNPTVLSGEDGRAFVSVSLGNSGSAATLTLQNTLVSSSGDALSGAGDVVILAKHGTSTLLASLPNLMERQPKSLQENAGGGVISNVVLDAGGVRLGTVELQASGSTYTPGAAASGLLTGDAATCQMAPVAGLDQLGAGRSPSLCTVGAIEAMPYSAPPSTPAAPCTPTSPGCSLAWAGPVRSASSSLLILAGVGCALALLRRKRRPWGA
jgi:hypothetical protein